MDQDRIDVLLAKYVAKELSPEENEELEWAVIANPALRVTLQVLQRMREMPSGGSAAEEQEMMERGLQRLGEETGRKRPVFALGDVVGVPKHGKVGRLPGRWWMAAAAVLVLAVAAGLLFHSQQGPSGIPGTAPVRTGHDKEITTRYGTRSFLELPDGSKLWLNAGSRVKYDEGFAGGRRELTLVGEAFFDVKHDPDHPFIIHTGELDVKVLGTSFNIKAYPNDSTIETTLIKGKVEIDFPGNSKAGIVLRPNEKVVVPVKGVPVAQSVDGNVDRRTVSPDPTYQTLIETSWVEDKLVFRNEAFSDVSRRLERWYNIHFSFEDEHYKHDRLTGYFKDQPIKNVMDALQISLGFRYRIDGDTIRIW
jgi:ferric-dicitrate binding protein FerR (iron transport regulator)